MADTDKPSRINHPFVFGVLVGLLLGIICALAVALYVNRFASPFVERPKPPELPKTGGVAPRPDAKKVTTPGSPQANADNKFEFYQVTPGDKSKADMDKPKSKDGVKDEKDKSPRADTKALKEPDSTTNATSERFYVQAGSFPNESDADNLKGKLAFMGLEATILPVDLQDRGTWYRVRLGPYKSSDEANRIKTSLSQNGIPANIIK